ncbi:MAG: hypothetical protein AB7I27_04120 [Bacteriovoracaceae bacterium]
MKFSIILVLVALNIFNHSAQAGAQESTKTEYYETWCNRVGSILRIAMINARNTQSYEDERGMLMDAIARSIIETPVKDHYYFLTSLQSIAIGLRNYQQVEEQVSYLRRATRYALEDLTYLDESIYRSRICNFCSLDHSTYVLKVLARGIEEGRAAKTDEQEIFALDVATKISISLLDNSNYRRDYACARKELGIALEEYEVTNKRDHLRAAWGLLNYRSRCQY